MKTRSKLLLAAVSLLTVSVAATATSAYAWYTANRQVQASFTQMGVSSTTGSLTIARPNDAVDSFSLIKDQKEPKYTPSSNATPDYTVTLTNVALTDVSSKGLGDFAKPKFGADGSTIVGHHTITSPAAPNADKTNKGGDTVTIANGVDVYGVVTMEFEIQNVTSNTSADDLNVYIRSASFTSANSKSNVINAARFSIIDLAVESPANPYLYCNPTDNELLKYFDSGTDKVKYLATDADVTNEENDSNKSTATTEQGKAAWIQDKNTGKLFVDGHADVTSPSKENNVESNGFLCKIGAGDSHRFLLTMWIEGTDSNCTLGGGDDTNIILETNLSLSISLYALSSTPDPTPGA